MQIAKTIKQLRVEYKYSQDTLAEKLFVSRQTISSWENDKSYPDIKSLLLISNLFDISLDVLMKGDIEVMKQEIKADDIKELKKADYIFTILLLAIILLPVPLIKLLGNSGLIIWGVVFIIGFLYSIKVEKLKKRLDVQTYKEILAFMDGKSLDVNQKNQEQGKRIYQKILLAIGVALFTGVVVILIDALI